MKKLLGIAFCIGLVSIISCEDDPESQGNVELEGSAKTAFVDRHNFYRSEVGIADIQWSEDLARSAQEWADELGEDCGFQHSGSQYGENIWKGTAGAFSIDDVVDSWGSEKADYDYDSNTCASGAVCGHYTQIVWENTTKVGCGVVTCDGYDLWVCQYDPPGNYVGEKPY